MKKIIAVLTLFLTIFTLASCDTEDAEQNIFRWVTGQLDTTINPHAASLMANGEIVDLITAPLFGFVPADGGSGAVLVPRTALSEPRSVDNGYTWIIEVNPDARFSNGTPITAHTFIYSWKMGLDPVLAYSLATQIFAGRVRIANAEDYFAQNLPGREVMSFDEVGMTAIDDFTIEIVTESRHTPFDIMLHFAHRATAPVYEPLYEAGMNADRTATLYGTELDFFVGNGPFILTSWTKGTERVFVRNENYLNAERIHLDGIHGRVALDESARIELFESGQSDFIELGVMGLSRYIEDPRLVSFDRQAIRAIEVNRDNPDKPFLDNPTFRRALFHATDRATIASLVNAAPAPFFLSPIGIALPDGTAFRDTEEARRWLPENYGFDPDYARLLMAEVMEKYELTAISIELVFGEDIQGLRAASEYIQFNWEQVFGEDIFSLTLRAMPHAATLSLMQTSVEAPTTGWDLAWSGRMLRAENFSPHEKFGPYLSTAPNRYTNYRNALLDKLFPLFSLDEYRLDYENRLRLTAEIEEYFVLVDATVIPVYLERAFVMFSDRVNLPLYDVSPIIGFAWEYGSLRSREE